LAAVKTCLSQSVVREKDHDLWKIAIDSRRPFPAKALKLPVAAAED
jgi:hypothetical protein